MKQLTDTIKDALPDVLTPDEVQKIAAAIHSKYRISLMGTPIRAADVRDGDLVRSVWDDGQLSEFIASGTVRGHSRRTIYLLDRPDDRFEFPEEDGSLVRLEPKNDANARTVASRERGTWYIAGYETGHSEDELRRDFCNFKLIMRGDA